MDALSSSLFFFAQGGVPNQTPHRENGGAWGKWGNWDFAYFLGEVELMVEF